MRRSFFTCIPARAVAFLGILIIVIALGETAFKMVTNDAAPFWISLYILSQAVIFLTLSLVIEYLARIAAALDKRAAPDSLEDAS